MDWTMKPFAQASHPPVPIVNGSEGIEPLVIHAQTGDKIALDASASRDPDGNRLSFRWIAYPEAGFDSTAPNAEIAIAKPDAAKTEVTVTHRCAATWLPLPQIACPATRTAHLILAVTDNGTPALTRYKRIIFEVHDGAK
jgi:hypothetical protein